MPPKSQAPKGKILNPDTNRYVGVDTKKGKELAASASASKTKVSPKKVSTASKTKKQKSINVLIHPEFGGFGLSKQAVEMYEKKSGKKYNDFHNYETHEEVKYRSDPILVSVVRKLGKKALPDRFGHGQIDIISIPIVFKDCFRIAEYDGAEGIDISSNLLVEHLLKTTNTKEMTPESLKRFVSKLQRIINTSYSYEEIKSIGY